MSRKTVSIKFDSDLWKKVKHHCVEEEIEISQFMEDLARKELED